MLIQPQSIFTIYAGVGVTSDRKHTILFNSLSEQASYYAGKTIKQYTDFSYVRDSSQVRVPANAEDIKLANYCSFQNVGFGNKIFYAFIVAVDYLNNGVASLTIEIDHIQTWITEMQIGYCFVEREHVANDAVGSNTVPEPIPHGENVVLSSWDYTFTNWEVILHSIPNSLATTIGGSEGSIIRNQYTGGKFYRCGLDAGYINSVIDDEIRSGRSIVSIYMCPSQFLDITTDFVAVPQNIINPPTSYNFGSGVEESYTPVNNKCFTYPYTFLRVTNNQGAYSDYRYEFNPLLFHIQSAYVNGVACALRCSYMGDKTGKYRSLALSGFPQCSWSENGLMDYLGSGLIKDALGGLVASATGGSAGTVAAGLNIGTGLAGAAFGAEQYKGNGSSGNVDAENGNLGFTFFQMGMTVEYAKIVDKYFTRFGYEVDEYKVPALNSRTSFNYVKTREAAVFGNIPYEANKAICDCLNSGITFWHSGNVRNYSVDNSIVSGV